MWDSAAQAPPVARRASGNSRPLDAGAIKDVCPSAKDQVKFISKLFFFRGCLRVAVCRLKSSAAACHNSRECIWLCAVLYSLCQEHVEKEKRREWKGTNRKQEKPELWEDSRNPTSTSFLHSNRFQMYLFRRLQNPIMILFGLETVLEFYFWGFTYSA